MLHDVKGLAQLRPVDVRQLIGAPGEIREHKRLCIPSEPGRDEVVDLGEHEG